ncbi:hypothetical protein F5B22DRAFT_599486 [Xylaria bambusicola]|uniref:uncharacterized protein n=1 Tax=Xylaria bambusicola TaxID=326684 RepID=UPI0020089EE5|nr:uncharacterized protein F5B22DRAFT_599486 [Xylaria bambusicola]KAI0518507.1 hypothetical protein F5B22DRAFT_599486 [Xylaria bambusicola]
MIYLGLNWATCSKAIGVLVIAGFFNGQLQGCEAAVIETTAIETTTTSSSINPWPTEPIYTFSSTNQCITTATAAPDSECMLAATIRESDPGFVKNWCGRKSWTTTETRTLTADCEGCNSLSVSARRGGCPLGGHHPLPTTAEPTPYYLYEWVCATSEASKPTIATCTPPE